MTTLDLTTDVASTISVEEHHVVQHRFPGGTWGETMPMTLEEALESMERHKHAYAPENIRVVSKVITTSRQIELTVIARPE